MNIEDTALILEEMNVKEEDDITMCELFDQYTRKGKQEGLQEGLREGRREGLREGLQKGMQALISTCRELSISFEETMTKLQKNFSLNEEEARKNMQLYW